MNGWGKYVGGIPNTEKNVGIWNLFVFLLTYILLTYLIHIISKLIKIYLSYDFNWNKLPDDNP